MVLGPFLVPLADGCSSQACRYLQDGAANGLPWLQGSGDKRYREQKPTAALACPQEASRCPGRREGARSGRRRLRGGRLPLHSRRTEPEASIRHGPRPEAAEEGSEMAEGARREPQLCSEQFGSRAARGCLAAADGSLRWEAWGWRWWGFSGLFPARPQGRDGGGGATPGAASPPLSGLSTVFLPQGFPDSVSPDYLPYQLWDSVQVSPADGAGARTAAGAGGGAGQARPRAWSRVGAGPRRVSGRTRVRAAGARCAASRALCLFQAFASSLAGSLATHAVLLGIGVGNAEASVSAATATWLVKGEPGPRTAPSPRSAHLALFFLPTGSATPCLRRPPRVLASGSGRGCARVGSVLVAPGSRLALVPKQCRYWFCSAMQGLPESPPPARQPAPHTVQCLHSVGRRDPCSRSLSFPAACCAAGPRMQLLNQRTSGLTRGNCSVLEKNQFCRWC